MATTGDPARDLDLFLAEINATGVRLAALLKRADSPMADINTAVRTTVTDVFRFLDVVQPLRKAGVATKDMHQLADVRRGACLGTVGGREGVVFF